MTVNTSSSAAEEGGYLKQEGIETTMGFSWTSCTSVKLIKDYSYILKQEYNNVIVTSTYCEVVGFNVLLFFST